ncbi:unnamed protein product [Lactuca saligna]|uniref:Uncharacterized protein n=1 Tax=Lactuca saligna TaxID=75948 RepID=A0AA35ZDZ7_LACSI|nr:unnamed protein product [Lactuca saligna]
MVSFATLEFDPKEDSVPDNMLMAESRLRSVVENVKKEQVERMKAHADNFENKIKKLHEVEKECHALFVEQVKTMNESLDLKVTELKTEMAKEAEKIGKSYSILYGKVDVVVNAIAKLVAYNTGYSTKRDVKTETDSKVFAKLREFSSSIKESISKVGLLNQYSVIDETITQMIFSIEANLKKELAPIFELILEGLGELMLRLAK